MASRNTIMVSRSIYQIAVMSFITSIVWVAWGIYQAVLRSPDLGSTDPAILAPIDPNIDASVVNSLSGRIKFDPNWVPSSAPSPAANAAISASKSATASTSATINKGTTK